MITRLDTIDHVPEANIETAAFYDDYDLAVRMQHDVETPEPSPERKSPILPPWEPTKPKKPKKPNSKLHEPPVQVIKVKNQIFDCSKPLPKPPQRIRGRPLPKIPGATSRFIRRSLRCSLEKAKRRLRLSAKAAAGKF